MIKFACPNCGKKLAVGDELAGKKGKCDACGNKTIIPASTALIREPSQAITPEIVTSTIARPVSGEIDCPFCGESIKEVAKKCKHCGEMLDGSTQKVVMVQSDDSNKTVSVLLGILVPGVGHIHNGEVLRGVGWFAATACGYAALAIPGIVLHVLSVGDLLRKRKRLAAKEAAELLGK